MRERKVFECCECEYVFHTDDYNTDIRYGINDDGEPMSYTKCRSCNESAQEL